MSDILETIRTDVQRIDNLTAPNAPHENAFVLGSALIDVQTTLEEAAAEIIRLRGLQEWIRVEDRLPETEDEVLVFSEFGIEVDRWRMQGECPVSFSSMTIETGMNWDDHEFDEVTHWMPIPPPPKGEEG